jgi:hypothetical protein
MLSMAHFSNLSEDLTTMWGDLRRPTKLHFLNQHERVNHNCHQVLVEAIIKEGKDSRTRTNHHPRINWISSIVSYELPPTIASIRRHWYLKYLVWILAVVCWLPCVFLILFVVTCALLEWVCLMLVLLFGPSSLKPPLVCKNPNRKSL